MPKPTENPISSACLPLLEVWRGPLIECTHVGAIAVVTPSGRLEYSYGDPHLVTYLRSSAKPFQLLPFIELGGAERFNLSLQEIAILAASHDGTDLHVAVLQEIQRKIGIRESDLQCGVHPPYHKPTEKALWLQRLEPTPNRHNCSGKHTAMLGLAKMLGAPLDSYLEVTHPVQQLILKTFSEIISLRQAEIRRGIDGCSAPVFGVPLFNAALGYARLADPADLPEPRRRACTLITRAMMQHPEMVAGFGTFDTTLMQVGGGGLLTKAGAEGFQSAAVLPGVIAAASTALGIALKVADGDISGHFRQNQETQEGRVRPIVMVELLRQLGVLRADQLATLAPFSARPQYNWRGLEIGSFQPCFSLNPQP